MATSPEAHAKRRLVIETLRSKRADFENFVRARVAEQDVDDILQLGAERAINGAEAIDDPNQVTAWLYRIHRNLIIDTYRRQAADRHRLDHGARVPDGAIGVTEETCQCSLAQAQRLPDSYASILDLVDAQGLSLIEAAARLDITRNNATVRLHRARKALRDAMEAHCGVTDPQACAACRCVDDACCAA